MLIGILELDADAGPERMDENSDAYNSEKPELPVEMNDYNDEKCDTNSIGSWKDDGIGSSEPVVPEQSTSGSPGHSRMSWADMAQEEEDELGEEDEEKEDSETATKRVVDVNASTGELRISMKAVEKPKPNLPMEQREYIRFMNVRRKKDYICFERFKGKLVNIMEGLELHAGIFSAAEQKRIVDYVYVLQEMGRKGELKGN